MKFATVKQGSKSGELVRIQVNSINIIDKPLNWQKHGLSYTASGYGNKIPTSKMVRVFDNRWRRVYVCIHSNIGTTYIVDKGENVIVELPA